MTTTETWRQRVADWKASGLTSIAYCKGKPFTAGGLRHTAYRLREEERQKARTTPPRIARVVPTPVAAPSALVEPNAAAGRGQSTVASRLVIECGAIRVLVSPGVDRGTLATVLDVLVSRGAQQ